MASNNNTLMLALVAGGGYLAYKAGLFKMPGLALPGGASSGGTTYTNDDANAAVGNVNSAPAPGDPTPAPLTKSTDPRGIRNNNPGNIVYNAANTWKGQIGTDGTFAKFEHWNWGLRAMMVLIRNYCKLYGACTIEQIINRWAPAPANNPKSYTAAVVKLSGMAANQVINVNDYDMMQKLVRSIITVENGPQYFAYYKPDDMYWAFLAWQDLTN